MVDDEQTAAFDALLGVAFAWRDDDPDPATRAELDLLVRRACDDQATADRRAARVDLADRFAGTLQFGTAGLRGRLGAGSNRMNRAVVIRAAAGLAHYLTARLPTPQVVVGYDARYQSDVFARDSCAVLSAAGCQVQLLPGPLPTPLLAFAVRHLDCDAGVMVTASHNPPQDNGYKVYLGSRASLVEGRGVQIVPPADADIAARIAAIGPVPTVPMASTGWKTLGDELLTDYLAAATAVVRPGGPRALDIVLTPLHGVGGRTAVRALTGAGFQAPYIVPEQADPDPAFPTVAFPNPEEPGAIDLAVAAARRRGADLVIANDPDADRCAVAVPDPAVPDPAALDPAALEAAGGPGWRMLRGDELGALLGEHLLTRAQAEGTLPDDAVVACSIVSSQLLSRVAAAHGVRHTETLTGFKWIARVPGLVYGYEEALGYCVAPDLVRDKDGITTALLVAELAASLKVRGRTLLDALDDLAVAHGVHATDQLSVRVDDLELITAAMQRLRARPPAALGGQRVASNQDLSQPGTGLPPTDGLRYRTDDGIRVVVRPSGTEPKLKCYLEAVVPVGSRARLAAARTRAGQLLAGVRTDLSAALGL